MNIARSFINNEYIQTDNYISLISPIDGSKVGEVSCASKENIDIAYQCANDAFNNWQSLSPESRIDFIKSFANNMIEDKELLAKLITSEVGKSYKDSLVEVERTYEYIMNSINIYQNQVINPLVIDETTHGIKNKVGKFYHVPIGVVLCISPFNYPINLSIAKIVPTLLMGNTVVFKPATNGSLVCSKLSNYFLKANFPSGVFNLIVGKGSEIGDYILENKYIKGITFTGSTQIGKKVSSISGGKNLVLELGGKDAAIVLDDIDVESVAFEIVKGAFNFSGQRCTAIKRVIVLDTIADKLVESMKNNIAKLTIGNPFNDVDIVPVINEKSAQNILDLISDATLKGASVIIGGQKVGYNLIQPTLIDHVNKNCKIAWEEPFGPVLPVIRVSNVDQAIEITNESNFGLQASIFTKNHELANKMATQIDVGTVNINKSPSRGPDYFPFVGVKDSGFGVQGILYSILAMSRIKGIVDNN